MMAKLVTVLCIVFIYYVLGGLATTNIMRLFAGETMKINYPYCECGSCKRRIPVKNQIPIFSMLTSGGKCRFCGSVIPNTTLFLEIGVFVILTLLSAVFGFKPLGVIFSFFAYEGIRWALLIRYGRRKDDFLKEYAKALLNIILIFLVVLFMSYLITQM